MQPSSTRYIDQHSLKAPQLTLRKQDASATTMAVTCNSAVAPTDCDFPSPMTLTVGPSTFHFEGRGVWYHYGNLDCVLSGITSASCALTRGEYEGGIDDWFSVTTPAEYSTTTYVDMAQTDIEYMYVTIREAYTQETTTATSATTSGAGSGSKSTSHPSATSATTSNNSSTSSANSSSSATAAASNFAGTNNLACSAVGLGVLGLLMTFL